MIVGLGEFVAAIDCARIADAYISKYAVDDLACNIGHPDLMETASSAIAQLKSQLKQFVPRPDDAYIATIPAFLGEQRKSTCCGWELVILPKEQALREGLGWLLSHHKAVEMEDVSSVPESASTIEFYSPILSPVEDILGLSLFLEDDLTPAEQSRCAAAVVYELTFFGWDVRSSEETKRKLLRQMQSLPTPAPLTEPSSQATISQDRRTALIKFPSIEYLQRTASCMEKGVNRQAQQAIIDAHNRNIDIVEGVYSELGR